MTPEKLFETFPELPAQLRAFPETTEFASCFSDLLSLAKKPSNCSTAYEAGNYYYLGLISPLCILNFGLSTPEKTRSKMQQLLQSYKKDPKSFTAQLVDEKVSDKEVFGPNHGR